MKLRYLTLLVLLTIGLMMSGCAKAPEPAPAEPEPEIEPPAPVEPEPEAEVEEPAEAEEPAAESADVMVENGAFSVEELKVTVGATVSFKNNGPGRAGIKDKTNNDVLIRSLGPGEMEEVVFEEAGEIEIINSILPGFKMMVTVE